MKVFWLLTKDSYKAVKMKISTWSL